MASWMKATGSVAAGVGIFVAGYQYAAALYGEDIAALREDYATRAQSLEIKYREKERTYAQSLVDAWEARDKALARVDDLGADLERVRKQAADAKRRLAVPATLKESSLPDARTLSSEAQSWFDEVSTFLSELR